MNLQKRSHEPEEPERPIRVKRNRLRLSPRVYLSDDLLQVIPWITRSINQVLATIRLRPLGIIRVVYLNCPLFRRYMLGDGVGTFAWVHRTSFPTEAPPELIQTLRDLNACDHELRNFAIRWRIRPTYNGECIQPSGCEQCLPYLFL